MAEEIGIDMVKKLLLFLFSLSLIFATSATEIKGDVSGDGKITSVDALIALKMSVGKIEAREVADMNNDGKVTSFDAFRILQLAVGAEKSEIDDVIRILNSEGFGKLFGSERMNWEVKKRDGSVAVYAVITQNGEVIYLSEGGLSDPTLKGYVSEETVEKIRNSSNWLETAKKAYDSGEIRIEGVGIFNKIKVWFLDIASKFRFG